MTRRRCGRCGKTIYTSHAAAEYDRLRLQEPDALNVFPCPHHAGWWHVGHVSSRLGPLLAIERAMKREPPPTE